MGKINRTDVVARSIEIASRIAARAGLSYGPAGQESLGQRAAEIVAWVQERGETPTGVEARLRALEAFSRCDEARRMIVVQFLEAAESLDKLFTGDISRFDPHPEHQRDTELRLARERRERDAFLGWTAAGVSEEEALRLAKAAPEARPPEPPAAA